jgi:tetraacyldisaccharide 4'-kinase
LIRHVLSAGYDRMTWARRCWYRRHPEAQRRLARPVVSVGNLAVGGSGKTPLVAYLARLLAESGERPAVLSRGYGRRLRRDGVVVVREAAGVSAAVAEAGDEPFMLARTLPGAAVLVAEDRYLAGRLAEARLGCTVHLLDDGFQHLRLGRDVDLLVVQPADLERPRVLPAGPLRERLAAAADADALVVAEAEQDEVDSVAARLGVSRAFRLTRTLGRPWPLVAPGQTVDSWPQCRVFAVAGIARPARFFADLERAGATVVGTRAFRDHHWFTRAELEALLRTARAEGADLVVTTEKDAARLPPQPSPDPPIAAVPLEVAVEPASAFRHWLLAAIDAARAARRAP